MGSETAGIDAAASLIDIARERNPNSELVLGSMFEYLEEGAAARKALAESF
jgi:hypothetical protein